MFVKDCMTRHPIMVPPEMPVTEVQQIMAENKVRHVPVVGDGKRLVGLVTRQRLAFKPATLASLSVWEITRYLSSLKVEEVMLKTRANEVHTTEPERTVEQAASYMAEYKIGCLPVVEKNNVVVGIISEIDLLRSFQDMLGLPIKGVRVTIRMPNKKGQFAALTSTLGENGLGIMGIGSFPTPRQPDFYDVVLKIPHTNLDTVQAALSAIPEQKIVDIRELD